MDLEPSRTPPPRERADAARNRVKILDAAARLFAEQGIENVSMDAVAAAAGVGKGTLFRRFGDRAGLAVALLDERERELQEAVLSGPAPLGPGAEAGRRLHAFVDAYLDYLFDHLQLVRMSETASPGARYKIGAYRFWHRHVTILLGESAREEHDGSPGHGDEAVAHAVLAGLAAEHVAGIIGEVGAEGVRRALHRVVDGVV